MARLHKQQQESEDVEQQEHIGIYIEGIQQTIKNNEKKLADLRKGHKKNDKEQYDKDQKIHDKYKNLEREQLEQEIGQTIGELSILDEHIKDLSSEEGREAFVGKEEDVLEDEVIEEEIEEEVEEEVEPISCSNCSRSRFLYLS